MKNKFSGTPHRPPERKELVDNPVKLCHDISRLSRAKARETVIEGVMSQPGARLVLAYLAVEDGISQRKLVENTHLRAPTVSVILRKMEEEGMVEIVQSSSDKREKRVSLTEHGRAVDASIIKRIKQTDEVALCGLSEKEYALLMDLLCRMRDNLVESAHEARRERHE